MKTPVIQAMLTVALCVACAKQDGANQGGGSGGVGGGLGAGGTSAVGGSSAVGGGTAVGGSFASGGRSGTGGAPGGGGMDGLGGGAGGGSGTGGRAGTGGTTTTGGVSGAGTGGRTNQGGTVALGGSTGVGGVSGSGGSTTSPGGSGGTDTSDAGVQRDSGAGTMSDTASTGGAAGYQPCPSGEACKILPLGDSITHGVGSSTGGSYRSPLFSLIVSAGQSVTFTGSQSAGPDQVAGKTFPKRHEGHDGWGISEVTPYSGGNAGIAILIPKPAFDTSSGGIPNIVLLHIGTNDQGSLSAAQMASDLSGLLDQIVTAAPEALVVVAQILPLGYGTNDVIKSYNQLIPGLVQSKVAAGKHIVVVDMFTGFNASSMLGSDKIHPNDAGYQYMAEHWYSVIGPLLPK
jgi:lysophospholipase L1-like esterase